MGTLRQRRQIGSITDIGLDQRGLEEVDFLNATLHDSYNTDAQEDIKTVLPSFHKVSCGGYNGRLAMAYRSKDGTNAILSILETMKATGERPTNTLAYNYILSALLEAGHGREALQLLREMEMRDIQPDSFTFELLLLDLSKESVMAITVDELFHLLRVRYGLKPTPLCWLGRLCSWMSRQNEGRVIQLAEEMRRTVRADPGVYATLARLAVQRNLWCTVTYFLELFQTHTDEIQLSSQHYYSLLQAKQGKMNPLMIPLLRFLLEKLDPLQLDEGIYARLLYFAARIGEAVSDLAYISIRKLCLIYKDNQGGNGISLPRNYLEAYVDCLRTTTDPALLRPPYKVISKTDPLHRQLAQKIQSRL